MAQDENPAPGEPMDIGNMRKLGVEQGNSPVCDMALT
jgi:hypothetical protein